jgi:hypothetical protein
MRKSVFVGMFLAVLAGVGCATVTRTPEENQANIKSIMELDFREMADDSDMIWMATRPSRLTRWHTR